MPCVPSCRCEQLLAHGHSSCQRPRRVLSCLASPLSQALIDTDFVRVTSDPLSRSWGNVSGARLATRAADPRVALVRRPCALKSRAALRGSERRSPSGLTANGSASEDGREKHVEGADDDEGRREYQFNGRWLVGCR